MDPQLFNYLSIRNDSELESGYIAVLKEQFEITTDQGLYQLALFAYHLLFICYFNQILNKMRIWFPNEHSIAFVSFESERRKKFREATNPTDYAHSNNRESSLFELLNLFGDCESVVRKCKKLVKDRNQRLGHVNYLVLSDDEFWQKLGKYDEAIQEVHELTQQCLEKSQEEFIKNVDKRSSLSKDEIDIGLVSPYKLSDADLYSLYLINQEKTASVYSKINAVIRDEFGVVIEDLQF